MLFSLVNLLYEVNDHYLCEIAFLCVYIKKTISST
jgi:hypothetical protein